MTASRKKEKKETEIEKVLNQHPNEPLVGLVNAATGEIKLGAVSNLSNLKSQEWMSHQDILFDQSFSESDGINKSDWRVFTAYYNPNAKDDKLKFYFNEYPLTEVKSKNINMVTIHVQPTASELDQDLQSKVKLQLNSAVEKIALNQTPIRHFTLQAESFIEPNKKQKRSLPPKKNTLAKDQDERKKLDALNRASTNNANENRNAIIIISAYYASPVKEIKKNPYPGNLTVTWYDNKDKPESISPEAYERMQAELKETRDSLLADFKTYRYGLEKSQKPSFFLQSSTAKTNIVDALIESLDPKKSAEQAIIDFRKAYTPLVQKNLKESRNEWSKTFLTGVAAVCTGILPYLLYRLAGLAKSEGRKISDRTEAKINFSPTKRR